MQEYPITSTDFLLQTSLRISYFTQYCEVFQFSTDFTISILINNIMLFYTFIHVASHYYGPDERKI